MAKKVVKTDEVLELERQLKVLGEQVDIAQKALKEREETLNRVIDTSKFLGSVIIGLFNEGRNSSDAEISKKIYHGLGNHQEWPRLMNKLNDFLKEAGIESPNIPLMFS